MPPASAHPKVEAFLSVTVTVTVPSAESNIDKSSTKIVSVQLGHINLPLSISAKKYAYKEKFAKASVKMSGYP